MSWLRWFERLLSCAERSAKRAPHGTRARRLRAEATRQWDAWYRSSRHSGSRLSPEDYPELRRRLRAVQADTSQPMAGAVADTEEDESVTVTVQADQDQDDCLAAAHTTRARGRLVELRVGRAAMLEAASDNIEALICYAGVLVDELGVRSLVIVDTETKERVWPSET